MERELNCIGLACPIPVVKTRKAIEEFTEDGRLTVLADNDTCVKNLTKLAGSMNLPVSSEQTGEKEYTVHITVKAGAGNVTEIPPEILENCDVPYTGIPERARRVTVVVSADTMGGGDPKLGKTLMKAFLYALTSTPEPPETMIFYNSGAYLTCEGSDSLEDLKNLEEAGTRIFTCGTCLNYYGLTEKLAIGAVTNMYDIVDMQMQAGTIIRP